jgi:phosphomannomutase / phosphoglucomutase
VQLSPSIFKAYDIRGIIDETLDPSIAKLIGQAFGTEMRALGESDIVIGRDGRLSGPSLIEALTEGLLSTGINVIDLGMVATPMVYFAANHTIDGKTPKSGIMITGSHNPPNYNGFKMVLGTAAIYGEKIQELRKRIEVKQFASGQGTRSTFDIFPMYLNYIVGDIKLARPMKLPSIAAMVWAVHLQVSCFGLWAVKLKSSFARWMGISRTTILILRTLRTYRT